MIIDEILNMPTLLLFMSDKEFLKLLGENIRKIREGKNLSQIDLAHDCGFEGSNMNRIEMGRTNITVLNLRKIGKSLSVKVSELTAVEEEDKKASD